MKFLLNLVYWYLLQHFTKFAAYSYRVEQNRYYLPYKSSYIKEINSGELNSRIKSDSNNFYNIQPKLVGYNDSVKKDESDENMIKLNIVKRNVERIDYFEKNKTIFLNQTEYSSKINNENSSQFWIKLLICIICTLMIMTTLVGNTLVILAVMIVRKLHTEDNANNYLIVSLAISDLLVGILDMPFALHVEVKEGHKWVFTAILCDLWTLFDVLLCTASILNLVAISIDRYFIIQHAMVYTQRRNAKLMILMILSVWLLSALISIPPLFGWGRPSINLQKFGICLVSQDLRYQIYATLLAFYIPLLVMIIIYINIYRTAKKIKKKELQTCGILKSSNHHVLFNTENGINRSHFENLNHQNTKGLISNDTEKDHIKLSMCSHTSMPNNVSPIGTPLHIKPKRSMKSKFQMPKIKHSGSISETSNRSMDSKVYSSSTLSQDGNAIINSNLNLSINRFKPPSLKARLSRRLTSVFSGIKRHSHISASQGKNQKATQTLGIIMGCFILCWLPFFILAVVKPIPLQNGKTIRDYIPTWLDSLLLWLGYFNSALNPIIYARFNREFRRPFIEILCFRCCGINEKLRDEERKKMYMDANLLNSCAPINHSIARTSASSATTGGLSNICVRNLSRKNHLDNDSYECLAKINDKNEKKSNINIIINNASDDNLNNLAAIAEPSKLIDENAADIETEVTYEDKKPNDFKNHKLNELVSSRFYNLTIMNDRPLSLVDDPLMLNAKSAKCLDTTINTTEIKLSLQESISKKKDPLTSKESMLIAESKTKILDTSTYVAARDTSSKLLLKQQSLNDNIKQKIKLNPIKQSFSNEFNKSKNTNHVQEQQGQMLD